MPKDVATLSNDDLARATLARQMLLERTELSPARALERLLAIQAQWPKPPFIAFFARLADFTREDLLRHVRKNEIVRGTSYRGTIFLQLAKDFARFRTAVEPTLERGVTAIAAKRAPVKDFDRAVASARAFFGEAPHTFDELRELFAKTVKDKDAIRGLAYVARMRLPLVQVATDVPWGWHAACGFRLAESVVDAPFGGEPDLENLVLRYLAALGPATVADAQTFTGVSKLAPVFERLRPKLVTFANDRKKELFDLPKAPRPGSEAEAPVRLLPDFDNIAIGHADRRRFVADEDKAKVYLPGLVVARTVLVGGRVAGTWDIDAAKKAATLTVTAFRPLTKKAKAEVEKEAAALLRFAHPETGSHAVKFA